MPAARSTRRSSLQLVGGRPGGRPRGPRDPGRRATCPGVGRAPAGPPRGLHPVQEPAAGLDAAVGDADVAPAVHRRAVAVPAQRAGRDEPLRGRRVRAQQRRRRVPEPHVPLPAAGHPLRRHGRRGRARLPGPRRADVLRRARLGAAHEHATRTSTRRCASTTCRPTRTGASGWRRSGSRGASSDQPAMDALQRRRDVARTGGRRPTRRSSTGSRRDAETALHPSCTARMGVDDASVVDPLTMRVHGLDGLRVVDASVDAVRHQRQHLRAGDDARREGRRPHPRRTRPCRPSRSRSTGTSPPDRPSGGRGDPVDSPARVRHRRMSMSTGRTPVRCPARPRRRASAHTPHTPTTDPRSTPMEAFRPRRHDQIQPARPRRLRGRAPG